MQNTSNSVWRLQSTVVKSCDDDDCVRPGSWAANLKPGNLPTYLELPCVRKATLSSSGGNRWGP